MCESELDASMNRRVTENESWQVFECVCGGWEGDRQAPLYYPDWLRKCSSSHLAITTNAEVTVSKTDAEKWNEWMRRRERDKRWKEVCSKMEEGVSQLISMSKRTSLLCLRGILARHKFDRCFLVCVRKCLSAYFHILHHLIFFSLLNLIRSLIPKPL